MKSVHVTGHFGELLQGRIGPNGPLALVTLPCSALGVRATLSVGQGFVIADDSTLILPQGRVHNLLTLLNISLSGTIDVKAEMPPGGGAGVSTAALVALARLAGWQGDPITLAAACIAVEGASDPLMLPDPAQVLWASRQGTVLANLPPLPKMEVIGGFFGAPCRTDPADMDFPDISDLIPQWQDAAAVCDLPRIAALASQSADRTLSHRAARPDPLPALADALGALGHVIAHTGSARGLIFAPGEVPAHARAALLGAGLSNVVQFTAGGGV